MQRLLRFQREAVTFCKNLNESGRSYEALLVLSSCSSAVCTTYHQKHLFIYKHYHLLLFMIICNKIQLLDHIMKSTAINILNQ